MKLYNVKVERAGGASGRSVSAMLLLGGSEVVDISTLTLDGEANEYVASDNSRHSRLASAILANLRVLAKAGAFDDGDYVQADDMKEHFQYSAREGSVVPGGWGAETTLSSLTTEARAAYDRLQAVNNRTIALCNIRATSSGKGAKGAKQAATDLSLILTGIA